MAKQTLIQNLKTLEDAYVFHQRMQILFIRRCISDSVKSSESRFVRRTFSASMIILWHSKSWWNQSYPQNSDVCTIVRTLYLIWLKMVLSTAGAISPHQIQIKHAPPSSINWSKFEVLGYDTWTILKELLFCQNHPRALRTSNTTWTHIQIQDSSFSFC